MDTIKFDQADFVDSAKEIDLRSTPATILMRTGIVVQFTHKELSDMKELVEFAAIHSKDLMRIHKAIRFQEYIDAALKGAQEAFDLKVEIELLAYDRDRKRKEHEKK